MNRLRNRLILVFVVATVLPLTLTLWFTVNLLDISLGLAPLAELDAVSKSLERTGRELYHESCELLRRDAAEGRIQPQKLSPPEAQAFWDSGAADQCQLPGDQGNRLDYFVRRDQEVWRYSRPMAIDMGALQREIGQARQALDKSAVRDLRRGFSGPLLLVTSDRKSVV